METVPFEEWWREFVDAHRKLSFDVWDSAVAELVAWVRRRFPEVQASFRSELVGVAARREPGWTFALAALEQLATGDDRRALWAGTAERLPDADAEWASAVLRVLVSEPHGPAIEAVRYFLLDRPIARGTWFRVATVCRPLHPDLCVDAFVRYFQTMPAVEWTGNRRPQWFLRHADTLTALKARLRSESSATWAALRDALALDREAGWLDPTQRAALAAALAD